MKTEKDVRMMQKILTDMLQDEHIKKDYLLKGFTQSRLDVINWMLE